MGFLHGARGEPLPLDQKLAIPQDRALGEARFVVGTAPGDKGIERLLVVSLAIRHNR
jgi:hypothetical protein